MSLPGPFGRLQNIAIGAASALRRAISYLLRDDFATNGLPLARVCEPGPGELGVYDPAGFITLSSGALQLISNASAWSGISTPNIPRATGLAFFNRVYLPNISHSYSCGFDGQQFGQSGGSAYTTQTPITLNQSYTFGAVVLAPNRTGVLIAGYGISGYVLDYVGVGTSTLLKGSISTFQGGSARQVDWVKEYRLSSPWDTDYGIATQRLAGARQQGDLFTHEPDCVLEFTLTTRQTSGSLYVRFRKQDDANHWTIYGNASGGMSLYEVANNVYTFRASDDGTSMANGRRIVIIASGATIKAFSNNALKFTYSQATAYADKTTGELSSLPAGAAVSDIISWPRFISGAALDALNAEPGAYLIRDEFTTDGALIPRTCEPGPGTLAVGFPHALSIANGALSVDQNLTTPYIAEPFVQRVRTPGMCVSGAVSGHGYVGFMGPNFNDRGVHALGGNYSTQVVSVSGTEISGLASGSPQHVILRSSGAFYVFGNTLAWVDSAATTTPLRFWWNAKGTATPSTLDYLHGRQLAAPWTDSFGIATQRLAGARAAGDTFTHEANCLIEWVVTSLPTGAHGHYVHFRRQDASNFWRVDLWASGWLDLTEYVNGTAVQRGTSGAGVTNGTRIVVIADGTTIKGFSANTLRWTYTSATNFQTATNGRLHWMPSGGISDIVSWPRTLSGAALDALNAVPQSYLLKEDFLTDGGLLPRTSGPGPGKLFVRDSAGRLTLDSGKLTFASGGSVGDPAVYDIARQRVAGLSLVGEITRSSGSNGEVIVGFHRSTSSWPSVHQMDINSGNLYAGWDFQSVLVGSFQTGVSYRYAVVLRTSGAYYFIKGGSFTDWTLLYVDSVSTVSPVYATITDVTAACTAEYMKVLQIGSPFDTEFGLVTQRLEGARQQSDVFTHEANCVLEWTLPTIPPAGFEIKIGFRYQDAGNHWYVQYTASGNMNLIERANNADTLRASSTGITNGTRCVVVADGTTLRGIAGNALKWTYSTATTSQTATAGRVITLSAGNGSVSNIISWPRTLSGAALAALEQV